MGLFYVDCQIVNVQKPLKSALVQGLLVDSGSEATWISETILKQIGVKVTKKDVPYLMANGQTITRSVGYAILRSNGFETVDEVVFGQPGDLTLLGARALDGFGAMVDPRKKRLIAAGPHPAA